MTRRKSLKETFIASDEELEEINESNNNNQNNSEQNNEEIKNENKETINDKNIEDNNNQIIEQVPSTSVVTVTTIHNQEITNLPNNEREYNDLELEYFEVLEMIEERIKTSSYGDRSDKAIRRNKSKRRNVTITIREDLSFILDYLVDDAQKYKGEFLDKVILLGVKEFIKIYGLQKRNLKDTL